MTHTQLQVYFSKEILHHDISFCVRRSSQWPTTTTDCRVSVALVWAAVIWPSVEFMSHVDDVVLVCPFSSKSTEHMNILLLPGPGIRMVDVNPGCSGVNLSCACVPCYNSLQVTDCGRTALHPPKCSRPASFSQCTRMMRDDQQHPIRPAVCLTPRCVKFLHSPVHLPQRHNSSPGQAVPRSSPHPLYRHPAAPETQ